MKNLFSIAAFTLMFLGFTIADAGTPQVKRSKSNVSNNKTSGGTVSDPKDEDCDGRSDAPDCVKASKANKDFNAEPYVEEGVVSPRDPASGLPTGKRMHKPVTVTAEAGTPATTTSSATATGDASTSPVTSDASVPASSEGCCPGRCCPPDAQDHAINTKGTGTAGIVGSSDPSGEAASVPAFMKNARKAKTSEATTNVRAAPASGNEGCCPGRCCPPDAQDHAINTKGTGSSGRFGSGAGSQQNTAQAAGATGGGTSAGSDNNPPPSDNFVYPNIPADVTHLKEMKVDDSLTLKPR